MGVSVSPRSPAYFNSFTVCSTIATFLGFTETLSYKFLGFRAQNSKFSVWMSRVLAKCVWEGRKVVTTGVRKTILDGYDGSAWYNAIRGASHWLFETGCWRELGNAGSVFRVDSGGSWRQTRNCFAERYSEEFVSSFFLLLTISQAFSTPLDTTAVDRLKAIVTAVLNENGKIVSTFFTKLINWQKGKSLGSDSLASLLQWLAEMQMVGAPFFELIKTLFNRVNNISVTIPSFELIDLQSLWRLLFETGLPEGCDFNLRRQSVGCFANWESVGSINALIFLVTRIENPLDVESLGIVHNEFIPPNSDIIVKLKGK